MLPRRGKEWPAETGLQHAKRHTAAICCACFTRITESGTNCTRKAPINPLRRRPGAPRIPAGGQRLDARLCQPGTASLPATRPGPDPGRGPRAGTQLLFEPIKLWQARYWRKGARIRMEIQRHGGRPFPAGFAIRYGKGAFSPAPCGCPGGETGRRNGLKIRWFERTVRVRAPPRAPEWFASSRQGRSGFRCPMSCPAATVSPVAGRSYRGLRVPMRALPDQRGNPESWTEGSPPDQSASDRTAGWHAMIAKGAALRAAVSRRSGF